MADNIAIDNAPAAPVANPKKRKAVKDIDAIVDLTIFSISKFLPRFAEAVATNFEKTNDVKADANTVLSMMTATLSGRGLAADAIAAGRIKKVKKADSPKKHRTTGFFLFSTAHRAAVTAELTAEYREDYPVEQYPTPQEMNKAIKEAKKDSINNAVTKRFGQMWKEATEETKAFYDQKAVEANAAMNVAAPPADGAEEVEVEAVPEPAAKKPKKTPKAAAPVEAPAPVAVVAAVVVAEPKTKKAAAKKAEVVVETPPAAAEPVKKGKKPTKVEVAEPKAAESKTKKVTPAPPPPVAEPEPLKKRGLTIDAGNVFFTLDGAQTAIVMVGAKKPKNSVVKGAIHDGVFTQKLSAAELELIKKYSLDLSEDIQKSGYAESDSD